MNKDRLNHYVLGVDWSCLIPTHADFSVKLFSGDFYFPHMYIYMFKFSCQRNIQNYVKSVASFIFDLHIQRKYKRNTTVK